MSNRVPPVLKSASQIPLNIFIKDLDEGRNFMFVKFVDVVKLVEVVNILDQQFSGYRPGIPGGLQDPFMGSPRSKLFS